MFLFDLRIVFMLEPFVLPLCCSFVEADVTFAACTAWPKPRVDLVQTGNFLLLTRSKYRVVGGGEFICHVKDCMTWQPMGN